jgi:hypothetical protein
MELEQALKLVKLAGYRVSKPRQSRKKDRVGPTFVARFADGQITRMSTYCESDEKLDWTRGQILAQAAWRSRKRCTISPALRDAVFRMQHDSIMDKARLADWCHYRLHNPIPPKITVCWFERDGVQLGATLAQAA